MFEAWIFPDFAGFIFRQIGLHCNMSIMGLSMVIYVILDVPKWVLFFFGERCSHKAWSTTLGTAVEITIYSGYHHFRNQHMNSHVDN